MNFLILGCLIVTITTVFGGIFPAGRKQQLPNDDDWEPVYRVYNGDDWNSHDDYISQERTAKNGDMDDSQFRSWKVDQWDNYKISKVRVQVYDDGDEVADFEFDGNMVNSTSFFNPGSLRRSNYDDIPDGNSNKRFMGDDFSFDGDDDSRHWTVSDRHTGDCMMDQGWFQVIDKPKPGRNRCVCGYENVPKYPAIMYSKGKLKTKWSNRSTVGYADMMQISVSHRPYLVAPPPTRPTPPPQVQQQVFRLVQQGPPQGGWFET